jgi:hypothetical protein
MLRELLLSTDLLGLHTKHSRLAAKAEGTKGNPGYRGCRGYYALRAHRSHTAREPHAHARTHYASSTTPAPEEQAQDQRSER